MEYLILALIGLSAGVIGALVGLGGGIILVPATLFIGINLGWIDGITPQTVVGLSVIMMIFTGLGSTLSYMKKKTVDFKSGAIFFAGSAPGTLIGAFVNKQLDLPSFNLYFGILLIILATLLLVRDYLKPVQWFVKRGKKRMFTDIHGHEHIYGYPIWFALLLTFGVGFASGLFGIGGGSIIVPAMILLFLFPPHVAVGTSMFMVFLSAIVNSITHISLGNVPWLYTIPVVPAAYFGAKMGAYLNNKMKSETLVFALRIILLLLGVRSIVDGIWG
ncbi:sulfite exporter TauE/SafE family protein [Sporosarcina pasteurii]|uniref:Probable membrane transporter protein n=1 Tax=Sporosarcina pasteurii TaxID=1474 RepID=A0A380C8N7_SPOPA|nr:sulfite exporter TauE/SafE family protein [Sporosarcina pasteurii]MDS9472765.1 sulfite exporter TauE/SafE family protein [Sporosarcina pasteurii]QBQ04417.1 sulfite exporter TauE/SafE family protein [Sporosarcina pasteurii]SUJ15248.1 Sulfite exporter TauE/SafE [Sporosarcina pasteurii]